MTPERQKQLLARARALRGTPSTAMAGVELLEAVNAIKARDKLLRDIQADLTNDGVQSWGDYIDKIDTLLGEEAKE